MRLNGRGLANIWEHEENKGLDIDCYEFQPSDFDEGIVMLTIEEAEIIDKVLSDFNSRLTEQESRTYVQLGWRIHDAKKQIKRVKIGNE